MTTNITKSKRIKGPMLAVILGEYGYEFSCKEHEDEDWVYFHVGDGSGYPYKVSRDFTEAEKVFDCMCCEINFIGDWIYHCRCHYGETLHKVRKDGTELTKLNDDYTCDVVIIGDWIYYTCGGDLNLYKIRTDGTERTKLNDDSCREVSVIGDWIYYGRIKNYCGVLVDDECDEIWRIRIDGTERTKLHGKQTVWFFIENEWIYYQATKNGAVYKVRLDGTEKTKLIERYHYDGYNLPTIDGDRIYYMPDDRALFSIRTDGSDKTKLLDKCVRFEIEGEWIYYSLYSKPRYAVYKMRIDGTDKIEIYGSVQSSSSAFSYEKIGDWIYCYGDEGIFKIHAESLERVKLCDDACDYSITIIGDWLLYRNKNDGYAFYRVDVEGKGRERLSDALACVEIVGDRVFYINKGDGNKLYMINTDGTEKAKLCDDECAKLEVAGDWVCYSVLEPKDEEKADVDSPEAKEEQIEREKSYRINKPSTLYRVRTDGTGRDRVCDDICNGTNYRITGSQIFFYNLSEGGKWYLINIDGTERHEYIRNGQ